MSVPGPLHQKMRIYHRYLGFFLLGIMAVYSISGIIMVFRDTDFLKYERSIHKQAESGLDAEKLGKALGIRNLKVVRQEADKIYFENGTYDVATGKADYKVKEYPKPIEKMTKLHKAKSAEPFFKLLDLKGDAAEARRGVIGAIAAWAIDHPGEKIDPKVVFPGSIARMRDAVFAGKRGVIVKLVRDITTFVRDGGSGLDDRRRAEVRGVLDRLASMFGYCDACAADAAASLAATRFA